MGGVGSNPWDESCTKELNEIIKETIGEFTKQYPLALAVNLVKKAQAEVNSKDEKKEESTRQLVVDPDPPKEVKKEGYLIKQGIVRKNWLKRYFVINPDYSISYRETKEAKEKGKFTLGGYYVADFNNKERPFTIHCKHYNKRNWYFQICEGAGDKEKEEEYKKWKDAFQQAARNAPSPMTTDPLLRRTYQRAYLKTYAKWWGWSSYFYCTGSESEMIGDLIYRRLRWGLLWRVYSKLKGPWRVQQTIRSSIDKQVNVAVKAACEAAWKSLCEIREKLAPELEAKIKEHGGPIFEMQKKVKDTIREKLMSVLDPLIEKTAKPIVEKVLDKALVPMADAHVEALKGFNRCCKWYNDGHKDGYNESTIRSMNWWSYWYLWESRNVMYQMQNDDVVRKALTPPSTSKGADDSGESKDDEPSNAGLAYKINDQIHDQVLAAIWTIGKDKDLAVVSGKFINDSKILLKEQYKAFILGVIQPNLMALANATLMELCKPIDDTIPELIKNFVSAEDMATELIADISNDIAEKFMESAYPKNCERMEAALTAVMKGEEPKKS
jgi:hypothetical protein